MADGEAFIAKWFAFKECPPCELATVPGSAVYGLDDDRRLGQVAAAAAFRERERDKERNSLRSPTREQI